MFLRGFTCALCVGGSLGWVACAEGTSASPTITGQAGTAANSGSSSAAGSGTQQAGVGGQLSAGSEAGSSGSSSGAGGSTAALDKFSFFVTSYAAIQRLSGSANGFGGDLRFGKSDGLSGADEICRQIAETAMPGAGAKTWHAFLSVTKGADGNPVNAIDRVGEGPWYDRVGRLVAENKTNLAQTRPKGADAAIINDLPNEDGVPNHAPDGTAVDNHDMLTGSNTTGKLYSTNWSVTCHDWTSSVGSDGKPRVGHSWPRSGGGGGDMNNWMSALTESGCAPGVNLKETGGPQANSDTVGSGGGYGGFFCFALTP